MNRFTKYSAAVLAAALIFSACDKEKDKVQVDIRMTDGPGDFQQVNIDLKEIRLKFANDTASWVTLNTNAGVYNLLDFQNGIDTLIATGQVVPEVLKEVRFVLGPNSTVMQDSIIYDLQTPSAESSGLKVKIDKDLLVDINTFVLDFDAALSIKQTGNGQFKLDPVIKLK